jgi:tetratricopeptide (TPR) repeat protein
MKCPNCGADMKQDVLYCEECGYEIHIVPDFEPELEDAWQQTIDNIANDIWEGKEEKTDNSFADTDGGAFGKNKKIIAAVTVFITAVMLVLIFILSFNIYRSHSLKYQTQMARKYSDEQSYDKAIKYYNRAIELDGDDVLLKIELADVYFRQNNKMEYEYLLREIVKDDGATEEQIESAYGKLIAIYRSRGDYQAINDFLQASGNSAVISAYQAYIAKEPEFSVIEGSYTSIQPLKLTSSGTGNIYYTTDGSDPDTNSVRYTTPILLENGDYIIKAVYVSENGIYSNIATKEYHIEIDELVMPEISVISGEYSFPVNIEVLDDAENVYYTTDGSTPNENSTPYTSPIPMPVGKSTFKFIRIEAGMRSAVEECVYQLKLNTDFTPQSAEQEIVDYCMSIGKIYDQSGHFEESSAAYKYQYQYVTNINDIDDFYVIMEIFRDTDNSLTRTGTYYAVNVYTQDIYKLLINDTGYTLVDIVKVEKNSQE